MKFKRTNFRLAEGHAKIMYRNKVMVIDAIFASYLINLTNGIVNESCKFPIDAVATYKQEGKLILIKNQIES